MSAQIACQIEKLIMSIYIGVQFNWVAGSHMTAMRLGSHGLQASRLNAPLTHFPLSHRANSHLFMTTLSMQLCSGSARLGSHAWHPQIMYKTTGSSCFKWCCSLWLLCPVHPIDYCHYTGPYRSQSGSACINFANAIKSVHLTPVVNGL